MDYIIFDLEATCWSESHDLLDQEIIEFGAFHINRYGEVVSKFNCFVRPVIHPYLSPFCVQLTSITQDQVQCAPTFPKVLERFDDWVAGSTEEEVKYGSWGKLDLAMILNDCNHHNIQLEWERDYFDIKYMYNRLKGNASPFGFKKSLRKERIEFVGTEHRAIDDAYNLARLFVRYIEEWTP